MSKEYNLKIVIPEETKQAMMESLTRMSTQLHSFGEVTPSIGLIGNDRLIAMQEKYGVDWANALLELFIDGSIDSTRYDRCDDEQCDDELCCLRKAIRQYDKYHLKDINEANNT